MDHLRLAVLCALFAVVSLRGQEAKVDIAQAVRDLGAKSFQVRKRAQATLEAVGWEAKAELEKAARSPDPEVVDTARKLLARILPGVSRNTPRKQRRLVEGYVRAKNVNGALQQVRELMGERPFPLALLLALVDGERDASRRVAVVPLIWNRRTTFVRQLLIVGGDELYARLLHWAARLELADAVSPMAAYAYERGKVEELRNRVAGQVAENPTAFCRRLLVELELLSGRDEEAVKVARELEDWPFLERLLVRTCRWTELATEMTERETTPSELRRLQLAAVQRLAGQKDQALATLAKVMAYDEEGRAVRLVEAAGETATAGKKLDMLQQQGLARRYVPVPDVAKRKLLSVYGDKSAGSKPAWRCLLALGYTGDGIQLLINEGCWSMAADLLFERRQYEEADRLWQAAVADAKPSERWVRAIHRAGKLRKMGDEGYLTTVEEILKRCTTPEGDLASPEKLESVIKNLSWAGLRDLLVERSPELLGRFQGGAGKKARGLAWCCAMDSSHSTLWWDCLGTLDPEADLAARAKRLRAFLRGELPVAEADTILRSALRPNALLKEKVTGLLAVARACVHLGRQEEAEAAYRLARRYAKEAGDAKLEKEVCLHADDIFGPVADWAELAEAFRFPAANGEAKYMVHVASFMAWGRGRESGRKLVDRAVRMSHFGKPGDLLEPLQQAGWEEGKRLLPLLGSQEGPPGWRVTNAAFATEDYSHALGIAQRRWYDPISLTNRGYSAGLLVALNAQLAFAEGRSLIAAGEMTAGLAKARRGTAIWPEDSWRLIGIRSQLRKAGAEAEGDALVDHALDFEQRVLDRFPRAIEPLNTFAWLSGLSQQRVGVGEACVRRAIERYPDESYLVETLAMLLYKSGEKARGFEQMRKCVKMKPSFRHLHRLGYWLEQERRPAGAEE